MLSDRFLFYLHLFHFSLMWESLLSFAFSWFLLSLLLILLSVYSSHVSSGGDLTLVTKDNSCVSALGWKLPNKCELQQYRRKVGDKESSVVGALLPEAWRTCCCSRREMPPTSESLLLANSALVYFSPCQQECSSCYAAQYTEQCRPEVRRSALDTPSSFWGTIGLIPGPNIRTVLDS